MKAIVLGTILFAGFAHAQGQQDRPFLVNQAGQFTAKAATIESIQTVRYGHVTAQEVQNGEVKVEGVAYNAGKLVFDATNPRLDVSNIVLTNGGQANVLRASGGDMGGGGRIVSPNEVQFDISILTEVSAGLAY